MLQLCKILWVLSPLRSLFVDIFHQKLVCQTLINNAIVLQSQDFRNLQGYETESISGICPFFGKYLKSEDSDFNIAASSQLAWIVETPLSQKH